MYKSLSSIISPESYEKTLFTYLIIILIIIINSYIFGELNKLEAQTTILPADDFITWTSIGPGGGGAITALLLIRK